MIHNVDAKLRQEEDAVALTVVGAAVITVVFFEPGIADGNTGLGLDAPMTGQDPGITVFAAKGNKVTLQAAVLDGRIETEGNLRVAHVIVAVDDISFVIPLMEKGITVFTRAYRKKCMTPLLVFLLVDVPSIDAHQQTNCPG